MADPEDFFTGPVPEDLWELCIGEKLGQGQSRHVYAWNPDPTLVVKIETLKTHWWNIEEFEVWRAVLGTAHEKWFAPVEMIAGGGSMLIQKRTYPLRPEELPDRLPAYFTDTKPENFGLLDGRVVCHDYSLHMMRERALTKHMRKVAWANN